MNQRDTTVVSVLTPSGRGAVAVVVVAGKTAVEAVGRYFQAANSRPLAEQSIDRIVYGHWGNEYGEDLVVCRRGEDRLEVHCHGGQQSSAQIIADLSSFGCEIIGPDEWVAARDECPIMVAAHLAMTQAMTLRTAKILLAQHHGALRQAIETIMADLADGNLTTVTAALEQLLQYAEFGRHLTEPWRVVIAGQPNVGKSSLINALVGFERAIVFDQPGTTRDIVSSSTAIEGWPVELSDTAGLHDTTDEIESAGIELARSRLADADLIVWVLDAITASSTSDYWELAQQQALEVGLQLDCDRTLLVINKIDLVTVDFETDSSLVHTSAVSGVGIQALLQAIASSLVPNVLHPDAAIPFTLDQVKSLQASLDATLQNDLEAARIALSQLLTE